MGTFARSSLWDFVLCIVASTAMCYTLASAFYSTQPFQTLAGLAGMMLGCAVLTLALFASTWSTRTALFGSLGIIVAIAISLGVGVATSTVAGPMDDVVGNNVYIVLITCASALVVFLLSRKRVTALVLVVLAIYLGAVIEYLYWYGHVASFVLLVASTVALFALRSYKTSVRGAEGGQLAFGPVAASGLALALVAALLSAGVFALVVSPLNPANLVVKIVTEHYRVDEIEVRGIASTLSVPGDVRTNQVGEQTAMSSDINGDRSNAASDDQGNADAGSDSGATASPLGMLAALLLGLPPWAPFILLLAVLLVVAAVIGLKLLARKRGYQRMLEGGNANAVSALYLFFLDRFKRLKMPEQGSFTLQEYVGALKDTFTEFEHGETTSDFATLTDIYSRCTYGASEVADAELGQFEDYYKAFYKRVRAYKGTLGYARVFMFI